MPKIVGRNERGFVDPLSLFGLLFLVVTLAAVTYVTANKNFSLNIAEKAGIDGSGDYSIPKATTTTNNTATTTTNNTATTTTNNTCDVNGTQYKDGSKVIGGGNGGNSGYSKCVNGRWTDCPECTLTSLTSVPVYKQAEYLAAIEEQQKAQQEAEQIERVERAERNLEEERAGCNTHGGQYQFTTGMCLVISTSQTLEKTDEGFITNSTTYVRDINTGKIVDAKTTSYIPKTTTTTTQNQGNTVTTSLTSYINPDTGQYYTDSTGKAIVNITGLSIIPLSDKRPTGASCTDSSECGSGSCGMLGHGRSGPPTLACLPQVLPDNNYGSCNGDPTCNSALTSIDRGMNAISFGGWSNYTEAYAPDKVKYTWKESGYKSVKECQDDMIAKNHNSQAAASCNTYQITKEQATSSIKLGTTLTAEAAAIIALPGAIAAGGTAITAGATTLQVGGAVLAPALTSFGAISTLQQTSAAVVAQIEDPGSPEAWKQTGYAAISWLNIGTADKLVKSFQALDAAKKAGQVTEALVTAAQSARNINNVVSGINVVVDGANAVSTCSQAGVFTRSCGGTLAAVGADIVFGTVDYKQGQLGFGNPLTKVNGGTLIGPLPDIKDPNGTRIATPAEIEQINQLIANPFGATPSISNIDGEVKFTPSRQLDMFDQLAKDPVANTSTVVNNGTQLILPDKPASQNPNSNFGLTKPDTNEVSAIAAFNSTDINTQGEAIAQLTPSNLNNQIPITPIYSDSNLANAPNTDVTAPKPVEPNANIADDITKPFTDTVNSPTTTNQSPTIASFVDESIVKPVNNFVSELTSPPSKPVSTLLAKGSEDLPDLPWKEPKGITTIKTSEISSINSQLATEIGGGGKSVDDIRKLIKDGQFDWAESNRTDPIVAYQMTDGSYSIQTGRHRAEALVLENVADIQVKLYELPDQAKIKISLISNALDQTKNVIDNLPDTGGAIGIIKRVSQIEDKISNIFPKNVDAPPRPKDPGNLDNRPKTIYGGDINLNSLPPDGITAPRLPVNVDIKNIDDVPVIKSTTLSDQNELNLSYDQKGSSAQSVNYAKLETVDGDKPVIIFVLRDEYKSALPELVHNAQLLDNLGIGPKFYGIIEPSKGSGFVMDAVKGGFIEDVPKSWITDQTIEDLKIIDERFRTTDYYPSGDFQYLITPNGRAIVIDPGSIAKTDELLVASGGQTEFLYDIKSEINRITNPEEIQRITNQIKANLDDSAPKTTIVDQPTKPSLFGVEFNWFKDPEGNFTLWPFEKVTSPINVTDEFRTLDKSLQDIPNNAPLP